MNTENDDIETVENLIRGDVEAFDKTYKKYSGRLYLFSMKYLRSTAYAEEIVQSVFLKVWENHRRINQYLSFKSFLFTIAYNEICKSFRKRKYLEQFVTETLYTNSESSTEMEDNIDFQSTLSRINDIIDMLPERQKAVFIKSRYDGKTTKEIAKEFKLSPGTVDNYISAAIKFIKERSRKEDIAGILLISLFLL